MIIVSAGLHRSGSTWLYNTLRMIYIESGREVYGSFIDQYDSKNKTPIHIVKTHNYRLVTKEMASSIFMTVRDLRDIIASAVRRNLIQPTLADVEKYLDNVIKREWRWREFADMELKYEEVIKNKAKATSKIAKLLGVKIDPIKVSQLVESLEIPKTHTEFNEETQLHYNHITNGLQGSYKVTLPRNCIAFIEKEYGWFLKKYGYVK